MREHLDLTGASGASYRFRLVEDPAQLPAPPGNFVYVRSRGSAAQVMCCAAADSLLEANHHWDAAVRSHGVHGLYIRLNIAWTKRVEEHHDLNTRCARRWPGSANRPRAEAKAQSLGSA